MRKATTTAPSPERLLENTLTRTLPTYRRPVPAIITGGNTNGLLFVREVTQSAFSDEYHFHEECQLAYIVEGKGKRIVGTSVASFESGDLVFIGSGVPHVWNTEQTVQDGSSTRSISWSMFISTEQFLEHLAAFGIAHDMQPLFTKARSGMVITGDAKRRIIPLLKLAGKQIGFQQTISLLKIVHILSTTDDYSLLNAPELPAHRFPIENERMDRVNGYILANFREDIQLQQVAQIASMNPQAFCRFFKSRTQKSLTYFINELRISLACRLLAETNESVAQIAYECGFNNLSNFNHFFKLIKKVTPRGFRNALRHYEQLRTPN